MLVNPKEFQEKETYKHFLLSEQRQEILHEVIESEQKTEGYGLIPSGPHGVGKSSIGLLLACYAFMNNFLLVYIVS